MMASNAIPHSLNIHGTSATDGAQSFVGLNLGTVNYAHNNKNDMSPEEVLSTLPIAKDAPFNAYQRQHEPTCLPDTRVDLLREIHDWAYGEHSPGIFWLSGLAGTGKSTIAQTVAAHYSKEGQLAASFFFSRAGGDVGRAGKFVTSVAFQIATSIPGLKHKICDAISKHSHIASLSLDDQWRELVFDPLSTLQNQEGRSSYVIVVDALDECENQNDVQILLQSLAEVQSLRRVRLRVLLTSRPEIPIEYGFTQVPGDQHQDFVLHHIQPAIIEHDISVFLRHSLGLIRHKHGLGVEWPDETAITCLVKSSSGLFIWAATALRFIDEDSQLVETRLFSLMNQQGNNILPPERKLDEIYATVLASSFHGSHNEEEIRVLSRLFRQIVGPIVIMQDSLSINCLAELLGKDSAVLKRTLARLNSVLHVPAAEPGAIQLLHPSFRDFLVDQRRCSDMRFYVDERVVHREMYEHCLRLLSMHLHRDMCNLQDPGILVTDLNKNDIDRYVQPQVQYACRFWIHHFIRSDVDIDSCSDVELFFRKNFLHWLETLTLLNRGFDAVHMMHMLADMFSSNREPFYQASPKLRTRSIWKKIPRFKANAAARLKAVIQDALRFTLPLQEILEMAPLQLYYAGILFNPRGSIKENLLSNEVAVRYTSSPLDMTEILSPRLLTVTWHTIEDRSLVFSPDGKTVASASWRRVRLWGIGSEISLQKIGKFNGQYLAFLQHLAFSPDGKVLAWRTHNDNEVSMWDTVKLWDTGSGKVLKTLGGYLHAYTALAFSPDGKTLASGSLDSTVRLWDTDSGRALQKLKGHSKGVGFVAFSPDGKTLASASGDSTVKLWDVDSGRVLRTLAVHSNPIGAVLAFSPDGRTLAARSSTMTRLWDTSSGRSLQTLQGHTGPISQLWPQTASSLSLDIEDGWLYKNGKRILWIPAYLRAGTVAIHGNTVAMEYFAMENSRNQIAILIL